MRSQPQREQRKNSATSVQSSASSAVNSFEVERLLPWTSDLSLGYDNGVSDYDHFSNRGLLN